MNKAWSEKNKKMQALISKEATFAQGIKVLIELRGELFEQITSIVKTIPAVAFWRMPFSRHWIMHVEAMGRIKDRLER